jgi:hypothetical protein
MKLSLLSRAALGKVEVGPKADEAEKENEDGDEEEGG